MADNFQLITIQNPIGGEPLRQSGLVGAVQASGGLADAGKVVLLDPTGFIAPSLIPPSGSVNFSGILTGTNVAATMTVDTGAALTFSGTGVVNASQLAGVSVTNAPTAGYVLTAVTASTASWQAGGGGSQVYVNGSPVSGPNFKDSATVTWHASGSNITADASAPSSGVTSITVSGSPPSVETGALTLQSSGHTVAVTVPSTGVINLEASSVPIPGTNKQILFNNNGVMGASAATVTAAGSIDIPETQLLTFGVLNELGLTWISTSVLGITGSATVGGFSGGIKMTTLNLVGTLTDGVGAVGTSGQVLSSTVTGTKWVTPSGGVTSVGLAGTANQITVSGSASPITGSGSWTLSLPTTVDLTNLAVSGTFTDSGSPPSAGTSGQVLSSTGTGVRWATIAGTSTWAALTGDLTETQVIPFDGATVGIPDTGISRIASGVLGIGNGVTGSISGGLKLNNLSISGPLTDSLSSTGISGQVLSSTGTGTEWVAGGFVNPMTGVGDMIYENSSLGSPPAPAPERLPIGADGQVLTVVSGLPSWSSEIYNFAVAMAIALG